MKSKGDKHARGAAWALEQSYACGTGQPIRTSVHSFATAEERDSWVGRAPGFKKRRTSQDKPLEVRRRAVGELEAQEESSRRKCGVVVHRKAG